MLIIPRYVLDTILSLDGGKPSSLSLQSPPHRIRTLLAHGSSTFLDLRLFAQVELNTLRTSVQLSVSSAEALNVIERDERMNQIARGTSDLAPSSELPNAS